MVPALIQRGELYSQQRFYNAPAALGSAGPGRNLSALSCRLACRANAPRRPAILPTAAGIGSQGTLGCTLIRNGLKKVPDNRGIPINKDQRRIFRMEAADPQGDTASDLLPHPRQAALGEVLQQERIKAKGSQLGWVCYRSDELQTFSQARLPRSLSWERHLEKQSERLGVDLAKAKGHLEWLAGYAQSIDKSDSLFCYGAVYEFLTEDLKDTRLHVQQVDAKGLKGVRDKVSCHESLRIFTSHFQSISSLCS
jgi:hypothetical protein